MEFVFDKVTDEAVDHYVTIHSIRCHSLLPLSLFLSLLSLSLSAVISLTLVVQHHGPGQQGHWRCLLHSLL